MTKEEKGGEADDTGEPDRLDAKLRQLRAAITAEKAPDRLLELARELQAALDARRRESGQEPGEPPSRS